MHDASMSTDQSVDPGRADKRLLLARLARAEGQVRGVSHMIEDGRDCVDVLTQVAAANAALNGVAIGLIDRRIRETIRGIRDGEVSPDAEIHELIGAITQLYRR